MHISIFPVIFSCSLVLSQVFIELTKVTLVSITPALSNPTNDEVRAFIGYSYVSELSTYTTWHCSPDSTWSTVGSYVRCCNADPLEECAIATACLSTSLLVGPRSQEIYTCTGTGYATSCVTGTVYDNIDDTRGVTNVDCYSNWSGGNWNATRVIATSPLLLITDSSSAIMTLPSKNHPLSQATALTFPTSAHLPSTDLSRVSVIQIAMCVTNLAIFIFLFYIYTQRWGRLSQARVAERNAAAAKSRGNTNAAHQRRLRAGRPEGLYSVTPPSHSHYFLFLLFYDRWRSLWRRPVERNYSRITWFTHCGKEVYADFATGHQEQLQDLLTGVAQSTHGAGNQRIYADSSLKDTSLQLQMPFSSQRQTLRTEDNSVFSPSKSMTPHPIEQEILQPQSKTTRSTACFLLLCVKSPQRRIDFANVDLKQVTNDPLLFQKIKEQYKKLRGGRFKLLPLYIPTSIKFIKFELFRLREGYAAGILEENTVPPESEVKDSKTYHYYPCPILGMPPIPPDLFMLGLSEPECLNEEDLCMNRLPKKLLSRLEYRARLGQGNIGWGVLITEGLNYPILSGLWLIILLLSSLATVLWSVLKGDVQGGFGIGSFLVGVVSAFLAALSLKTQNLRLI